jgi:hypothetical protein
MDLVEASSEVLTNPRAVAPPPPGGFLRLQVRCCRDTSPAQFDATSWRALKLACAFRSGGNFGEARAAASIAARYREPPRITGTGRDAL